MATFNIAQQTNATSTTGSPTTVTATLTGTPASGDLIICSLDNAATTGTGTVTNGGATNAFSMLGSTSRTGMSLAVWGYISTGSVNDKTIIGKVGTGRDLLNVYQVHSSTGWPTIGAIYDSAATGTPATNHGSATTTSPNQPNITSSTSGGFNFTSVALAGSGAAAGIWSGVSNDLSSNINMSSSNFWLVDGWASSIAGSPYNPSYGGWNTAEAWCAVTIPLLAGTSVANKSNFLAFM